MGIVGVGFASALAGQASKHTHKMISTGANPFRAGFWEPLDVDDMVFDALLGIFVFKVGCSQQRLAVCNSKSNSSNSIA